MNEFWLPLKEKFFDYPEFREFVVQCGCAVHQDCMGEIHPHHTVYQSQGVKSSDLDCIGLCAKHHAECHQLGRDKFAFKYDLDYRRLERKYIHAFLYQLQAGKITTNRKPKERKRGKNVAPLTKTCNTRIDR